MRSKHISMFLLLSFCGSLYAQDSAIELVDDAGSVLPRREQAILMNHLLKEKQETVLPTVMRETGFDMWIVSEGEGYLHVSLIDSGPDGAVTDRSSYLVFSDRGEEAGVERIHARRDDLARIIKQEGPKKIAFNSAGRRSARGTFSESELEELKAAVGSELAAGFGSARTLTNRWMGTNTDEQMSIFKHVLRLAHEIIAEAYSNRVIVPDVTTTDDLNWWIRQRYADLGIGTEDHPTITIQRSMAERAKYDDDDEYFRVFDERFKDDPSPRVGYSIIIRRGDLIFCDTGIKYLGLYTDTQQSAYVLKPGETDAPEGLKEAFRHVVRFQDLIGEEMKQGRGGNEIGVAAAKRARTEGIDPYLYAHSLSYYFMRYGMLGGMYSRDVHFAGSGLSSSEDRDRRGGSTLHYNTLFALELDVRYKVPEWDGQQIVLFSETGMGFTREGMIFPGGRQTEWYLIK